MTDLGLSALTDDQLVELAQALAAELSDRNPSVYDAAKAAVAAATMRAAATQDAEWARKKYLGLMARQVTGGEAYALATWQSEDRAVTRVYLEPAGRRAGGQKWCLHVTGGRNDPPGRLTVEGLQRGGDKFDGPLVRLLLTEMHRLYPGPARVDCEVAAATSYPVPAPPPEWTVRLAEIARLHQMEQDRDATVARAMTAWDAANPAPEETS